MEYLLCAMHCSKCFIGIDLFVTTTYEAGPAFFPPCLKMFTMRMFAMTKKEVKYRIGD